MFISLIGLGINAPAFALEVKLHCSIRFVSTHSNGHVQRENFTDLIDIQDDYEGVTIIPQSENLMSVNTIKTPITLSVNNYSDRNKWHIIETTQGKSGKIARTSINIDRNTGILFYSQDWGHGKIMYSATGLCEKVDATKRKF